MTETWKPIPGYEGYYSASTYGRILSVRWNRILKSPTTGSGYATLKLSVKNRAWQISVHQLVMLTFVGKCPTGMEVNHIDGDKLNNHLSNLEYITREQNQTHAYKTGLSNAVKGDTHYRAKLTREKVIEARQLWATRSESQSSMAERLGVHRSTINDAIHNRHWR